MKERNPCTGFPLYILPRWKNSMPNLESPCKVLFYSAEGDQPGFDHNFVVSRDWEAGTRLVAVVSHPPSGRQLEVFSNQPGLQFYTGIRLLTGW
jgi:galactose mutarotase-like enzyme